MTLPARPPAAHRAGISLLEVLISIGILSIGLLATLALIPAGRYYMKRAAVDDRAAAAIPSAFASLGAQGLFRVNASSWQDYSLQTDSGLEYAVSGETPVVRELTQWRITETTSEDIINWWPQFQVPQQPFVPVVSGSAPPPAAGNTLAVSLAIASSTSSMNVAVTSVNQSTGQWVYTISPSQLPAPDMQINRTAPNLGEVSNTPFVDYTFTATYTDGAGPDTATTANPSGFRQYGQLRQTSVRRGRSQATYRIPASAARLNETAQTATSLTTRFPTFDDAGFPFGNRLWRRITTTVASASVARWKVGLREGDCQETVNYERNIDATGTVASTIHPLTSPITTDQGDAWVNGEQPPETDVDWYRFDVRRGDLVNITWSDPDSGLDPAAFRVWLNTTDEYATSLAEVPAMSTAQSKTYYMNADGFAVTKAAMDTNIVNRTVSYSMTLSRYRTGDRSVVLDPLMATRLDKTLPPRAARRLGFAAFNQLYLPSATVQPTVIPRLNCDEFANRLELDTNPPSPLPPLKVAANQAGVALVDLALAESERAFRAQDAIAIDPPADTNAEDAAPRPRFDMMVVDPQGRQTPARRQSEGKGSWLVMLEPMAAGPASWNWTPGSYFKASIVVFENRPLPPISSNAEPSGEYAFDAVWDDLDGMITVRIPAGMDLVDEDIRALFKAGCWILLAPKTVSDATSATQTLDWVQIQSATLQGSGDGSTVVKVLPAKEPAESILNTALRGLANPGNPTQSQIWVLVYEGAVAVVSKTVQLQP